MTRFLCKI